MILIQVIANNSLFIEKHRNLLKDQIEGLVLTVNGGTLRLYNFHEGMKTLLEENQDFRPFLFHRLKEISHIYMSIYLLEQRKEERQSD